MCFWFRTIICYCYSFTIRYIAWSKLFLRWVYFTLFLKFILSYFLMIGYCNHMLQGMALTTPSTRWGCLCSSHHKVRLKDKNGEEQLKMEKWWIWAVCMRFLYPPIRRPFSTWYEVKQKTRKKKVYEINRTTNIISYTK